MKERCARPEEPCYNSGRWQWPPREHIHIKLSFLETCICLQKIAPNLTILASTQILGTLLNTSPVSGPVEAVFCYLCVFSYTFAIGFTNEAIWHRFLKPRKIKILCWAVEMPLKPLVSTYRENRPGACGALETCNSWILDCAVLA